MYRSSSGVALQAERSLEEEEPPSSARFLLMTFGMWLVYTLIYEYMRRLCRRYWVVELSEPRAKGQRESQTDVLAQEHGAVSASAQSTVTHVDRGVKANDLPAQIASPLVVISTTRRGRARDSMLWTRSR